MKSKIVPILAPYEKTRPGFEMLIAKTLKGGQDIDCFPIDKKGYQKVCLWNIWAQKKDPADTDEEKQKINKMQQALGTISDNDRYLRIQIACLARCYWTFPNNVDLIINGIVKGWPDLSAAVGCEPPWNHNILPLLRQGQGYDLTQYSTHHIDDLSREEQIFLYTEILNSWLVEGDLSRLKKRLADKKKAELAGRIYGHLGKSSKLKSLYIHRLCWSLSFSAFSSQARFRDRWKRWSEIAEIINNNIRAERGKDAENDDTIIERIEYNDENGSCHHAFFRHIEHIIAHIGANKAVMLPGTGRERKRIHSTIVNYVHTLVSWLAGRTIKDAVLIWPDSKATLKYLYEKLGKPTLRKRWLIACLWKKLLEDRALRGRGALDEDYERFACPPDALAAK
jgi:hypothetical protein